MMRHNPYGDQPSSTLGEPRQKSRHQFGAAVRDALGSGFDSQYQGQPMDHGYDMQESPAVSESGDPRDAGDGRSTGPGAAQYEPQQTGGYDPTGNVPPPRSALQSAPAFQALESGLQPAQLGIQPPMPPVAMQGPPYQFGSEGPPRRHARVRAFFSSRGMSR